MRSLELATPEFPEARSYSLKLMDFLVKLLTYLNVAGDGNNGFGDLLEGVIMANDKQLIK